MATFQEIYDKIVSMIQKEVDAKKGNIAINLEITASSLAMDLAKNLQYSIKWSKFDGYNLHTCRVRETVEYIWLNNQNVETDINIKLNIELKRIE